jgi:hypothetical protein
MRKISDRADASGGSKGGKIKVNGSIFSVEARGIMLNTVTSLLSDIHYTYLLCIIPSHIRIHTHPDRTSRRSNRIYTTIWSKYIHSTPNTHPGCYQHNHPLCPKWTLIPTRQITKTRMIRKNRLSRYQV